MVVGRIGIEDPGGYGEEGHMLDIRVVDWIVGDNMVNVMIILPPTNGKTSAKISNHDTNQMIDFVDASNSIVAGIMSCKSQLMPETGHADSTQEIVPSFCAFEHKIQRQVQK
jgi:hypothetical protein